MAARITVVALVRIRQIRYTPRWMQEPIHMSGAALSVHCGDVKGK